MRQKGFTLIELLVVVTIMGIVAAMAYPSFNTMIKKYQINSVVSDYRTAIQFARNQAISTGNEVVVKPVGNGWNSGVVVVMVYPEGSDNACTRDNEDLSKCASLRYVKGISTVEITEEVDDATKLTFNGKGFLAAEYKFGFCDSQIEQSAKQIHLLKTGISAVKEGGC